MAVLKICNIEVVSRFAFTEFEHDQFLKTLDYFMLLCCVVVFFVSVVNVHTNV